VRPACFICAFAPLAAMILLVVGAGPAPTGLRSPWDTRPKAATTTPGEACKHTPDLTAGITASDYYNDSAHSVVDPARLKAYRQAVAPLQHAAEQVVAMADRYRTDGDSAAADCAAHWLGRFAADGVLTGSMSSNQAYYVQGWMLGAFAVAWLKIRPAEPNLDPTERARLMGWLARVADDNRGYYDPRTSKTDAGNNHRYWAGFAVMAAGIAADRRDLFDWGIRSFEIGVDQITTDGTLPLEMARRSLALHYHLFAAAPLVAMAELAAANGVDLYSRDDHAVARLVDRAVSGVNAPDWFAAKASVSQEPIKLNADDIAWAAPFARRFRDTQLEVLLAKTPSHSILYLGGLPPP
jgi:poly(beta-D-mannuronate) lyase